MQDEESKLGSYKGFAQQLEVQELSAQRSENESKALKFAIKSVEQNPAAKTYVEKLKIEFNKQVAEYEKQMNLHQLSIKTQVEIQLGLILSGLEIL